MLKEMSDIKHFLEKANINLLWEVLLDELDVNENNIKLIDKIKVIFTSNMEHFVASVSKNINNKIKLVELNKQFLSQIILAVKKLLFSTNSQMKKITIANEEINEPYKIEDIHLSRQHNFESQVEKKRVELDKFMTPEKPKALDFSDKKKDGKITAMDSLIAEKMAERELDIHTTYTDYKPDTWLKPTETSIKNDKQLKKVSWTENVLDLNVDLNQKEDSNSTSSIFNKLKKTQDNVVDKQYITQQSIPLQDWADLNNIVETQKTTPLTSTQMTTQKTQMPPIQQSYNNETKDEISKINTKIDTLFDMMRKLQETLDKNNNITPFITLDI
jgi:hypothetical protein